MRKLYQLKRLNFSLAIKILIIYLKRLAGFKWNDRETGYISYLFTLETCHLNHLAEEDNCFKVATSTGISLYLRKYPSSDSTVLQQIWTDQEYGVIVDFIKEKFRQPDLYIVDAGANVGYSSVYFFQHLKSSYNIKLIVVEPSAANLAILEKNFAANHITDYHIEKAGLYNKSCYLRVLKDFRDGSDWSLRVAEETEPTDLRSVELQSLVDKYGWPGIDFCKIDIEGSEHALFRESGYARRMLNLVRLMSIEIHEDAGDRQRILNVLQENDFKSFDHGELTIGYRQDK